MCEKEEIEMLKNVLAFYADSSNYLYFENRFLEYGERNLHLQATNAIGHKARKALEELS